MEVYRTGSRNTEKWHLNVDFFQMSKPLKGSCSAEILILAHPTWQLPTERVLSRSAAAAGHTNVADVVFSCSRTGCFFTLILHAQRLFSHFKAHHSPPPQALTRFLVKQRGITTHSSVSPHTDRRPGAVATRLNGHETIYLSPDRDRQVPSNRESPVFG